jgi:hypothetical protein
MDKYNNIPYNCAREGLADKGLCFIFVKSEENLSDNLTKHMGNQGLFSCVKFAIPSSEDDEEL